MKKLVFIFGVIFLFSNTVQGNIGSYWCEICLVLEGNHKKVIDFTPFGLDHFKLQKNDIYIGYDNTMIVKGQVTENAKPNLNNLAFKKKEVYLKVDRHRKKSLVFDLENMDFKTEVNSGLIFKF